MSFAPPEPGQLVEVRRRQWVVTDVQASAFQAAGEVAPQHMVSLAALDEDSMNESLSAVWELEPGARVLETAGLPSIDGWDSCERIQAFLDAVRWGAATDADRSFLQAPFRSGVEIQDFQLDPLVRAIDMARVNLLIADDVGLGKTIEAGLVIQELLVRHRARSVLVVCPASLQVKWQTEMHEKFGLEFRIVDTDQIKRLRRERGIHAKATTRRTRTRSTRAAAPPPNRRATSPPRDGSTSPRTPSARMPVAGRSVCSASSISRRPSTWLGRPTTSR